MFAIPTLIKKVMAKLALAVMLTGMFAPMHAAADGNTGVLTIRVNPTQGTYQVLDDVTGAVALSRRSGNVSVAGFPAGDFRIAYEDIAAYTKPADEHFSMLPGGQITLIGDYRPITVTGTLSVVVSPAAGTYEVRDNVTGEVVVTQRSGSQNFVIPFGDYVVDFKDIAGGYSTPADQSFTLDGNHLGVAISGTYQTVSVSGSVTVMVSPALGKYEIKDNVTGALVVAETVGSKSFVLPFGDYVVDFKDIAGGYVTPADLPFSLNPKNSQITLNGNYEFVTASGTLTVTVSPAAGTYEVRENVTGAVAVAQTSGNRSFVIPYGDYIVDFKDIAGGYIAPADQTFSLNAQNKAVAINGNYTTQLGTGTVVVNVINQDHQAITDAKWELRSCTGATLDSCATKVANNTQSATLNSLREGTYAIFADLTPAYSGRVVLGSNPQALAATQTIYFNILYTANAVVNHFAGIQVTTQPVAGGIKINGQSVGAPASAGAFIPTPAYQIDVTQANTISFDEVANYIKPADIVIPAGSLVAGFSTQYTGTYQLITNNAATLALTTTPVAGEIFMDGVSIGTPANAGAVINVTIKNPGDRVISFGDVANYTKPANQTISVTAAQIQANATIPVNGVYTPIQSSSNAILSITTNVANAPVSVDGVSVGNAGPNAPVTKVVPTNVAHTISFGDMTDFVKPADIVIAANTLQKDDTKNYVGTYTPARLITITKTATESPVANNNKRVDYVITVTNISNSSLNVSISDTITGNGKISNNAGELAYVPNTFKCEDATCTAATVNGIANQPVSATLQTAGSKVTVKYQMLSSNASQTAVATFANVATATYTNPDNQKSESVTATHSVSVNPPTPVTPPSGSSSGSTVSFGGGGGYTMIKGDMDLDIQKQVSLDGINFRNALGSKQALAIPENKATRLYTKITLTNPGEVSAKNIRFAPFFDQGESDMTADKIQDLKGATLDVHGLILIEKLKAKESVSFSYSVLVHENGQNKNPAIEGLEVSEISSTLPENQDGLTYKNLGEKIGSYLYAGRIPAGETAEEPKPSIPRNAFDNGSDMLSIKVSSDLAQAAIGDTVNFSIILENVSDQDLTNLFITHAYPAELNVLNAGGARDDGRELAWKAPILRPGETVTKHLTVKVMVGAPGSRLHSLTRALVSEAENITPVDSYLMVLGGAPNSVAKAYHLVQTGPAGILGLLMLSALIALAFNALGKRRALKLKELALKPL